MNIGLTHIANIDVDGEARYILEFLYGLVVIALLALGIIIGQGLVIQTLLSLGVVYADVGIALEILYVNALSLAALMIITYYYVVHGRKIFLAVRARGKLLTIILKAYR